MGSPEGCRRSESLCSEYVASPECARKAELRVFYALHHRYRPGDYETWKYIAPIQKAAWSRKAFEYGTWGGEIRREFEPQPGEIVAQEHWGSSGFANTDLDLQLKRHGIHQLIVIGLIAHTCVEATVRYAAELGYEVTVVKMRRRVTRMTRCMPLSTSISQTTPVPSSPRPKSSNRSLLSKLGLSKPRSVQSSHWDGAIFFMVQALPAWLRSCFPSGTKTIRPEGARENKVNLAPIQPQSHSLQFRYATIGPHLKCC